MWWKSDEGTLKIYYSDVDTNQWVDASPIGDPFENTYASIAFFPQANVSEGAFAFSELLMQCIIPTVRVGLITELLLQIVLPSSDFSTLLANTQLTYTIDAVDYTTGGTPAFNDARKILRLSDSQGVTDDIVLTAGTGLSIIKSLIMKLHLIAPYPIPHMVFLLSQVLVLTLHLDLLKRWFSRQRYICWC